MNPDSHESNEKADLSKAHGEAPIDQQLAEVPTGYVVCHAQCQS